MKRLLALGLYLGTIPILLSQQANMDSIKGMSNLEKSIYFNKAAHKNRYSHLDSSVYYTDLAIKYSSKCDCDSLQLESNFKKAFFLYHRGNYESALKQLQKADSLNSIYKNDFFSYKISSLFGSVQNLANNQGNGLDYSIKALEWAEKLKDSFLIAEAYEQIGYLYTYQERDSLAKKYLYRALDVYERLKVPKKDLYGLYVTIRETSNSLKEFDAITKKVLETIEPDNASSLAYTYITGSTFLMEHEFDDTRAKLDAERGLKIVDSIQYIPLKRIALYNLGYFSYKEGNYQQAISYFLRCKEIPSGNHQTELLILTELSKAYTKLGNYKLASEYKDEIIRLKDSVFQIMESDKYFEYDVKYKTAEKDKAIALQQLIIAKQNNTRNLYIFSAIALLLLALGIFLWFSNKQKRKKLVIETKLQKEQEINDLRTKFLGNIAHEIRTPLTLVTGNLNLALENLENPKKAKKNINTALENSKRITADANEILELLKFENSTAQLKKETVLLDETLKRIVFSFNSLVEIKQIALNYKSEIPKNLFAEIDIEKTEKIINNLLSNAIKYSPSNTEINAKSKIENGKLVVTVTDFGDGIHYDETEKIFERFYQSVRNTTVGGIGIGLSLSRELAEAMYGSLTVNSEWKKGSTFTFTVPVTEVDAQIVPSRKAINPETVPLSETPKKTKPSQHSKILIVEDNPEMVNYLVEILSPMHQCEVAFDGEEALQKINSESFDLITSDIMMPKMDGFQLREALNQSETFKNIPFILLSAKTLEDDKIRGFKLGIDDYIVKPFNKNELIARINNLLSNKLERQAYQIKNPELLSTTESSDQKLLKKVEQFIMENIDNEEFKIQELAESVGYSQRQFTRILKQYTGFTPVKFILEIRLQKAYQHLQNKTFFTLSEVRYHVGISSSAYFNKKFRERFGINPSELLS